MHLSIPEAIGTSPIPMLDGYLPETEYARQRGVSLRTCQRDRALRQSPPYVVIGRQVYYRIDAIREWLLTRENHGVRLAQSIQNRRGRT